VSLNDAFSKLNQAFNQSKLTFEQLNSDTHLGFAQIVKMLEGASEECETRSQLLLPITSHSQTNASFANIDSHLDKALKDITNKQKVDTLPSFFDEFNGIEINENFQVNHFFKYNQLDLLDSLLGGSNVVLCDTNNNNVDSVEQQDPPKQPTPPLPTKKIFDNKQQHHLLNNEKKDMAPPPPPPPPPIEKQPSTPSPILNTFDKKQKNMVPSSPIPPPAIEKRTRRNSRPLQTLATIASVAPPLKSKPVKRAASSASFDKENKISSKKIKIELIEEAKKAKKIKKDTRSKCCECQMTFNNAGYLLRHMNNIHKQNKVVKVKNEAVNVKMADVRVEAVKPVVVEFVALDNELNMFQCEICTKRFTRENTLAAHIKSFHWNSKRSASSSRRRRILRVEEF
jgi:hypothetical protein